ncbi:hypothetical protein Nepgr_029454 [Nepenthes gracilis]|uniref:Small multi-drug export protein n=1 Tax=Nepenthes gracilis TaxID=150966 RepID=A0AAD3TE69_NEPGR|nr:hypothetical protein Nepgr_029454 [Nepenthes gracilis]
MAATATVSATKLLPFPLSSKKTHILSDLRTPNEQLFVKSTPAFALQSRARLLALRHFSARTICFYAAKPSSKDGFSYVLDDELQFPPTCEPKPVKTLFWVLFWASVSLVFFAFSKDVKAAATDSIRASSFGLKIASALRSCGWPDETVVFALATLPVIELRGAIPVGYWMQMNPTFLTVLSVLGNMLPVPFIILYLKKFTTFLAGKNRSASQLLQLLFRRAKRKASPIEEFQWLGLMLFVAVPFPGTGAWTGAIIASILDMPFWPAVSANFFGVVLAGLLVNLLVNLGLKYAIVMGVILFFVSSFMWSVLRSLRKRLSPTN